MSAPPLDTTHISEGVSFYVSLKPLKPEPQMLIGKKRGPNSQATDTLSVTSEDSTSITDELVFSTQETQESAPLGGVFEIPNDPVSYIRFTMFIPNLTYP